MGYHNNFDKNPNGFLYGNSKAHSNICVEQQKSKKSYNTLKIWVREFSLPNVET